MLGLMRLAPALALAVVLTLAGCGDDQTGTITDEPTGGTPTGTPEDTPEDDKEPGGEVDFELVELISMTAAGGEGSPEAVALGDEMAVQEFTSQFESEAMQVQIQNAVEGTEVPDDQALYGAVVAIGCDVPPGVNVYSTDTGLQITGQKVASPMMECFAPVTTVALVLVDESVVG